MTSVYVAKSSGQIPDFIYLDPSAFDPTSLSFKPLLFSIYMLYSPLLEAHPDTRV